MSETEVVEKSIMHYRSSHKSLLVGEGDFSFSACLANAFGSAVNMVATSLDSREELLRKYSRAAEHLKVLEDLQCTIINGVDTFTMNQHPLLNQKFDRIVFNFPHAELIWREHDSLQIECHQELVKGFLRNARGMLTTNGEVHVTHKTAHPFNKWEIEKLGEDVGLWLMEKVEFKPSSYPRYCNKRGYSNRSFPIGEASTFKFTRI